ncbi:MAG TPA: hypothetical protein VJB94_03565 [Candidatus Nanoarchaeia archaeon]|nr:hypothetical protein [Candidatus Nanoarchaeia archaeon]
MLYSVCFFPPQDFIRRAAELRKKLKDYSNERPDYLSHCLLFKSYLLEETEERTKRDLEDVVRKHDSFKVTTGKICKAGGKNLIMLNLKHSSELFNLRNEVHAKLQNYIDYNSNFNNRKKIFVPNLQDLLHYKEFYHPFISLCKTDSTLNGHDLHYFENFGMEIGSIILMIKKDRWEPVKNYPLVKIPPT